MHFVYLLGCLATRRTYVGQTDDLLRRYQLHREGSTRTTRERFRQPVVLWWEVHPDRASAMRRERYLKQGAGHRFKTRLAEEGFTQFDNALG